MGLTPLTFAGISQYSQDFQTILQRVTTIASFPLNQLKNEQQDVAAKRLLTSELSNSVKLLGDKITALKDVAANRAVSATSSNTSKLTIDSVNTDTLTTYNITDVTLIAVAASETSLSSYASSTATQVSASGSVRLTVGTTQYDIALPSGENNLVGLRDKINTLNSGVTATILTVDATTNYLSISANATGAKVVDLREDPLGLNTSLLTATNQGSNLNFKLNGVQVSRSSNLVNDLVSGVSFTLKQTTSVAETLSIGLSSDRSKLSAAVSGFIDAYNTVQAKITGQVGKTAGLLTGDFLVREAQDILRKVSSFGLGAGSVKNWSDLGVNFSTAGQISFEVGIFNTLSQTQLQDSFSFFKDTTGLGSLSKSTDGFSQDVSGLAAIQIDQYGKTDSRLTEQIAKLEDRISVLRQTYLQKLQTADALLGNFESQRNVVSASLDGLNLVLYGKRNG